MDFLPVDLAVLFCLAVLAKYLHLAQLHKIRFALYALQHLKGKFTVNQMTAIPLLVLTDGGLPPLAKVTTVLTKMTASVVEVENVNSVHQGHFALAENSLSARITVVLGQ